MRILLCRYGLSHTKDDCPGEAWNTQEGTWSMDSVQIRRAKLVHLITWPGVLVPAVAGAASLALGALTNGFSGGLVWTGLAAMGVGAAAAAYRWFAAVETLEQQALDRIRLQAEKEHLDYLKQLRRRLRRDRDPRTGKCLKRLHGTYERLGRLDARVASGGSRTLTEVVAQAKQLYQSCLELLERSLVLWNASQQMSTDDASGKLLESRDQLLDEVDRSIDRLDKTLDGLQVAALNDNDQRGEHSRLRAELDEGLAVAQRVQQRMDALEQGLSSRIADG